MLRITRGDDKSFGIQFPEGTDLTGCTVFFTAKPEDQVDATDPADNNAVLKGQATGWVNYTNRTVIALSATETRKDPGIYLYDIQVKDTGGKVKTYGKPRKCEIVADVGQRTT